MNDPDPLPILTAIDPDTLPDQCVSLDQSSWRLDDISALHNSILMCQSMDYLTRQQAGVALLGQGDLEGAIQCFVESLHVKPDCLESLLYLGQAHVAAGRPEEALDPLFYALALYADSPEAHLCMADALRAQGNHEGALECFLAAHEIRPDDATILLDLGSTQTSLGLFVDAVQAFRNACELNPCCVDACINLAAALHVLGEFDESIVASYRALALQPDHPLARFNLSLVQLLLGDYAAGFDNYEHRFHGQRAEGLLRAQPPCTRWQDQHLPAAGRILLVSEQGLGDTVQFMRFLPELRSRGLSVRLCAEEQLHGLIKQAGVDDAPLTPPQANHWSDGCWLPLLSLPRLLGVRAGDPLRNSPYLQAPLPQLAYWSRRLEAEPRPIIGLHWQGNPSSEAPGQWCRSLALEQMRPIAALGIGSLVSLQKGDGAEQRQRCSFAQHFVACQAEIDQAWDFLDALALIACCDLVITSDSCLAHLAGAMGHPTWLLLARVPDWRWGLESERTSWYPSMQLFRQRRAGDWSEVMERVAAALPAFLAAQARRSAQQGGPASDR